MMKSDHSRPATVLLMGLVLAVASSLFLPRQSEAGVLYGSSRDGDLFTIDTGTGVGTPVGLAGTLQSGCCTDIEHNNLTGDAFAQDRNGAFTIKPFDINTGAVTGEPIQASNTLGARFTPRSSCPRMHHPPYTHWTR